MTRLTQILTTTITAAMLLAGPGVSMDLPEEHVIITTTAYANGKNDDDGVHMVLYDYDPAAGTVEKLLDQPTHALYPANAVDFRNQLIYYANGRAEDGFDNLYTYDLQTGETQQITDGKFRFDDLILVDGNLYTNTLPRGASVSQPAIVDVETGQLRYLDRTDDDTWHYSFSYHYPTGQFSILTCSDAEMRTYHVAAETHIRPKTISFLDKDLAKTKPAYFTENFEIRLTRQLDENHILMTADPYMGGGPRRLKLLTVDTQTVEPFDIPGIAVVYLFYPSADGQEIYFIGKATGSIDWEIFCYHLDSKTLQKIPLPEDPRTIVDIQYTLQ